MQNGFGEEIPPEDEYPQFLLEFTAVITVSNADNISVAIEPASVIVTKAMLNSALADKADRSELPTTLPANGGNADTVNGHTVNADVPVDAKFTDTKYTHPTTAGNKHIPAGGSSGQILKWAADGTAAWGADNNTTYSNMTGATASAAGKAGLVPAPAAGSQAASFLKASGAWASPLTPVLVAEIVNLDDFTTSGCYYFASSNSPANAPVTGANGWLFNSTLSSSRTKQIWLNAGSESMYVRTKGDSGWSAWRKVLESDVQAVIKIVQGTITGLTVTSGTYYVPYAAGARSALVEVWETTGSATSYGSRYMSGFSSSMTAIAATTVVSTSNFSAMVGADSTGRITINGSVGSGLYMVTWFT